MSNRRKTVVIHATFKLHAAVLPEGVAEGQPPLATLKKCYTVVSDTLT